MTNRTCKGVNCFILFKFNHSDFNIQFIYVILKDKKNWNENSKVTGSKWKWYPMTVCEIHRLEYSKCCSEYTNTSSGNDILKMTPAVGTGG